MEIDLVFSWEWLILFLATATALIMVRVVSSPSRFLLKDKIIRYNQIQTDYDLSKLAQLIMILKTRLRMGTEDDESDLSILFV